MLAVSLKMRMFERLCPQHIHAMCLRHHPTRNRQPILHTFLRPHPALAVQECESFMKLNFCLHQCGFYNSKPSTTHQKKIIFTKTSFTFTSVGVAKGSPKQATSLHYAGHHQSSPALSGPHRLAENETQNQADDLTTGIE